MKKSFFILLFIFTVTGFNYTYIGTIDGLKGSGEWNKLDKPSDVFVFENNIYVVDTNNQRVEIFSPDYFHYRTIGGTLGSESHQLCFPYGIFIDGKNIYVVDAGNARIQVFRLDRSYLKTIGKGIVGKNVYEFHQPRAVFATEEKIYVADTYNSRIQIYNKSDGTFIGTIGGIEGALDHQLNHPNDIFIHNNRIYVVDTYNNRVQIFTSNHTLADRIGWGSGEKRLKAPEGIFVTSDKIYIADTGNHRVAIFSHKGEFIGSIGGEEGTKNNQFSYPRAVFATDNKLYVADSGNHRIQVFSIEEIKNELMLQAEEKLAKANQTFIEVQGLLAEAREINILLEDTGSEYLQKAYAAYYKEDYINASVYAEKALLKLNETKDEVYSILLNKINTGMENIKTVSSSDINFSTAHLEEKLSQAKNLLLEKKLLETLFLLKEIKNELQSLDSVIELLAGLKKEIEYEIGILSEELVNISSLASTYHQNISLSEAYFLLNESKRYLAEGRFSSAKSLLVDVKEKISKIKSDLRSKVEKIIHASEIIESAKLKIMNTTSEEANELLEEAKNILYADPEEAVKLAEKAINIINISIEKKEEVAVLPAADNTIYIILFILVIGCGIGITYYFLRRKPKGKAR